MVTKSLQLGIQDFTRHNNIRHLRVPNGSKFSTHLASIPNGENVRFRPAIFIALVLAPFSSKWHKKLVVQEL